MKRTVFNISKMDCPSEEQIIRMALGKFKFAEIKFDLNARELALVHDSNTAEISHILDGLHFGSKLISDMNVADSANLASDGAERGVLRILLAINFSMFVIEMGIGFYAQSTGLISDSFDMLADAIVYGLSLYAVGKATLHQRRITLASGWFQVVLAFGAFGEVIRRFILGSDPSSSLMIITSVTALCANLLCLLLLAKHRNGKIHMQASWIFSSNDVLANLGVIVSGFLVSWLSSSLPDLLIGFLIAVLVASGAIRILRLASVGVARA